MATNSAFTLLGPKIDSKTVVSMLFREPSAVGRTCNACNKFVKQTKKTGYTNLLNHLVSKHPGYEDIARKCLREKRVVTMDMFVDRHTQETYQWMNLVVHKNFTFADVDDETVRAAVKFNSMSSKTLKARMVASVKLLEPLIIEEVKDERYVLVFDGVTDNGEHSLAVFVVTRKGWRFLALSSFVDERSMTADEHIRFLDLSLDQYQLNIANIVGIVCDNMETNKAISRRVSAPMIGCAAHRFNLAVKDYIKAYTDTIKKVSVLMRKLKSVKRIALLKENGCKWKPVAMHELRWSGIHRMLKRYKQLQPYLYLFERDCEVERCIPEDAPEDDTRRFPIVQYLPSPAEHCAVLDLLDDMDLLELATKRLQARNLTLVAVRDILDETLVDFPKLADRLKADADIVESPAFEIGVVKIMQGREQDLTAEEAVAVVRLQRFPEEETNTSVRVATSKRKRNKNAPGRTSASKKKRSKTPTSPAPRPQSPRAVTTPSTDSEPAPRRRRTPAEVKAAIEDRAKAREEDRSKYIDLNWLPATSVEVERLFSTMKCMLGYLRKRMSAETLETILFLRMNWDLVTNEITSKAVQTAIEDDEEDEGEEDNYQ